jgi:potassium efflux system protein
MLLFGIGGGDRLILSAAHALEPTSHMPLSQEHAGQKGGPTPVAIDLSTLSEQRKEAQADLEAIRQALSSKRAIGAAQDEQLERQALLEQLVRGYDEQLSDIQRLADARQRLADTIRNTSEWKGIPDPPPYSIIFADQVWDAVYSLELAVEGLQSQQELLTVRFEQVREAQARAEERLRQASELLEAENDAAEIDPERRRHALAALRVRATSVLLEAAQISSRRVEEELNGTKARLAFEQRRLDAVSLHAAFSEKDLAQVRSRLDDEHRRLEEKLEATLLERQRQSQAVQEAEHSLNRLRNRQAGQAAVEETPNVARARVAVELAQARLDNRVIQGDLVQQLMNVVAGERQLWESRFVIAHTTEAETARETYRRHTPLFDNVLASRNYVRQQSGIVSGQISELENRVRHAPKSRQTAVHEVLQAFHERQEAYTRALHRMDEAVRFMERWRTEFKQQQHELPLWDRLDAWLMHGGNLLKDTWRYELFTAEDTIEVDGKSITGSRSVTLGKLFTALVILLIGYVVCIYVARTIGRVAVAKFGMAQDVANLVRQWSQAFLIMFLIVLSFTWVKIPLTIFAFLGGAFAIGAGFGAQTLLKNVISGILVLIERPLRVGDLIEVDNIRGRVTSIGLRSSTIRDVKGMETLIPNSSFLERYLTNWTYSSRVGRFSLRVGVPYGIAAQQIADLLSGLAVQHHQIMTDPPPQVLLDEFGSQARIFTINYWLEIAPEVDPSRIASELRFAIEQKFAEGGLKVMPAAS